MRVLHVIPAVAVRYGGTSTNLWPLVRALGAVGVTVEVATTDADGLGGRLTAADLPTNVTVHLFKRVGGETLKRSPGLETWLAANIVDFDVVHVHSLWNRPATMAASAAHRARVPYVVRPAGMLSAYTWGRGWLKKRAYWWLAERRTVREAAAIHVTSPEETAEVRACGVMTPVVELPNGLDADAFDTPPRPDWLRDRCGAAAGNRPIVLFLSRLHPKKGVTDLLLPAFARLPGEPFLAVIGGADDTTLGYPAEVRAVADRLGVTNRVALLGPVRPNDRWAAFDGASVFCLPSYNENFGSVVPEAVARGCPVVVTEGVAAGRMAVTAGAGVVVPRTVEAVADALAGLLNSQPGQGVGRAWVERHLSWVSVADRLMSLYHSLRVSNAGSHG